MADDLGERTEAPTPKRREEARKKGQVPRSADLTAAVLLSAGALLLFFFGADLLGVVMSVTRRLLGEEVLAADLTGEDLGATISFTGLTVARALAPLLLAIALAAIVDQIGQVGLMLSPEALKPKLSVFNLAKGAKKLLGGRALMKGLLAMVKVALIGAVMAVVIGMNFDRLSALPGAPIRAGVVEAAHLLLETAIWALLILALIGLADRAYQVWQHTQDLKMTKQEVKEERKSTEGDAQMKSRRINFGRELIRQQMRSSVPKADVVVTNPTHFAVALKYDEQSMNAPRVLAKGADHLAIQIRLIAASHGVPMVERPPLARALYHNVEIGREIPGDLYEAVAEVLAYVYRLEGRTAS